ncbi:hypothetical protein B5X24_HaOG200684 [Helicoverpa armigera]|uniref:Gustatory receptor n=1 Tax=Helicoverpa armigera TaxID=29058 RepID=A0A2W1BRU0_HELAM|nr:hypothetical protein B5X24_HaOG200684 [Helicoverpa armigera]
MWYSHRPSQLLLFTNKLDKDVQRILKPFNIILTIFFSSKFKIRNGYITPCDKKLHIILFICVIFLNAWSVYEMRVYISGKASIIINSQIIFSFLLIICFFTYFILIFSNIAYCQSNILLIYTIQDIHRAMRNSSSFKNYITWNWITILICICFDILIMSSYCMLLSKIHIFSVSTLYLNMASEINVFYCIRVLAFLIMSLEEWIENVLVVKSDDYCEEYCGKLFKVYQDIIKAHKLLQNCFRLLVRSLIFILIKIF